MFIRIKLRSEAVVQAEADDVFLEGDIAVRGAAGRRAAGRLAEIDVEIFDLGRPSTQEGVFEADAGRPAKLGFGLSRAARDRHLDVAERCATSDVRQPAIEGIADAA